MSPMPRRTISLLRILLSLIAVGAITLVCSILPVNATTAGFAFLLLVLAIATVWGFAESVAASVAAMLCYNFFFLPPLGRFTIADPQNWVALIAFLVTSLIASQLSNRARNQAAEADRRRQETEQLYALSRAILLTDTSQPIGAQAAQHIAQIFDASTVALYDATSTTTHLGGPNEVPAVEAALRQVVMQGAHLHDPQADLDIWPITLGGRPIGALAAKGIRLSDGAVQALLNLVAIALERVRMEEAANRAEVARQSEEFKSTLLDAVAHEFKTPLTSIKAASTSILTDRANLKPQQVELASIIDEETDRLSLLVTEAVRMSEIDAGKVRLERASVTIRSLLDSAVASFGTRAEGRILPVEIAAGSPPVRVDPDLITLALRQLIDNALKYSPATAPVQLRADTESGRAVIHVIDRGPGIAQPDRDRVFDKFYRRQGVRNRVPGSGLGLHIAREIARTHGGDLWIADHNPPGAEFCLALPLNEESHQ